MFSLVKMIFASGEYKGKSLYDAAKMGSFYDLNAKSLEGEEVKFQEFAGKMNRLYDTYGDKGFTVLAFPCGQFMNQEFQTAEEIREFVDKRDVKFPLFEKGDINGKNTQPVYKWLKTAYPGDITWNFHSRFLINKDGVPVARYDKGVKWETIEEAIKAALAEAPSKPAAAEDEAPAAAAAEKDEAERKE